MDACLLPPIARLLAPSAGIRRIPHLAAFLPEVGTIVSTGRADAVAGWGFKPTARRARAMAASRKQPYIALEDGFFRSVGLGEAGAPTLSLVLDDLGIYYDAREPSRLEAILAAPGWATPALIARAEHCIARIVATGLSKTNQAPLGTPLASSDRRRILLVDQTEGDAAIAGGLAGPETFAAMLATARSEHPDAEILVRRHPAVAAGLKRGCLPDAALRGATLLDPAMRLSNLLAGVDEVYVVTSLSGFEALLRGIPVRCFGAPFYAGWGLTRDEIALPRRERCRTLPELFAAACMLYTRYVDPLTGRSCSLETALDRLLLFRDRADAQAGLTAAVGFSRWKRAATEAMLTSPRGTVRFFRSVAAADRAAVASGRLMVWGGKETGSLRKSLDDARAPVVRMEDGFIRSAGLGSDFNLAGSVVIDDLGIYYDPGRPSRLELLLETGGFPPELLARAAALRARLIATGVSKYNVGRREGLAPPPGRATVLVVGQVEDDRSIELGCTDIRSNAALLRAVREDFPDAWIAYKPHPDVAAGNRTGAVPPSILAANADRVVTDLDLVACLGGVGRLATMTSLSGFEALLRGVPCSTYGMPFYAGWGLTEDRLACPRRTRGITLDELIAATLILYPIYQDPASRLPCPPEHLVEVLATARSSPPAQRRWRYWRGLAASLGRRAPPRY